MPEKLLIILFKVVLTRRLLLLLSFNTYHKIDVPLLQLTQSQQHMSYFRQYP